MSHSLTPQEHQHNESVMLAAHWLADQHPEPSRPVPELQARFSLSAVEACEAIAMARRFRMLRRAFS